MTDRRTLTCAVVAVTVAVSAALGFESVYNVSFLSRRSEFLHAERTGAITPPPVGPALSLRLVDTGGVGIPPSDTWGADYSHDRRVFRDVVLERSPYVNQAALDRVDREWRDYVRRMLDYGNNAIVVPMLLELIDFERVGAPQSIAGTLPIYAPGSAYRARHDAVRRQFGRLFDWTRQQGMQVFLDTDMLTLTPPLSRHLRALSHGAGAVGIDTSDPAVWQVYRAGLEELFDRMPSITGVVIRFGEGGSLYNGEDWPYRSEMAVRDAASLRAMLHGLLPLFEARDKTLILRSWTVGIGPLGRLHVDPDVYERVLGDIDSPALIVSTKFTAGDFFSYLPVNPTLVRGRHRRIVELQAKPEFEGFGAFPNFLGYEHARALREIHAVNPQVVGMYVLAQFGGPLRAGPRMLYPLHGYWWWTDANVYVASRLGIEPDADVDALARRWASATFGPDPRIVDAVARVLRLSREAVLDGFYIRPFAERRVSVPGLELPPLMWIFEWDMVGGWHSLLSLVYQGTRDHLDAAIDEGHAAAALVRHARQQFMAAVAAAGPDSCPDSCDATLRSLEYQETLFDALATWRQAFLNYYHWLDTGDAVAWNGWRNGRQQFEIAAARHIDRFGHDVDFPAFDLDPAYRAVSMAERGGPIRALAVGLLFVVTTLLAIGSPLAQRRKAVAGCGTIARVGRLTWMTALTPWRLHHEAVDLRSAVAITMLALVMVGCLVGSLTGFATVWASAAASMLFAVVGLAFAGTATGMTGRQAPGRILVGCGGPLMPGLLIMFALFAYFGPVGFWHAFWTQPAVRVAFLSTLIAMLLWTASIMVVTRPGDGWHGRIGSSLIAVGAGIAVVTALLPGWVQVLRLLDRPLNFAPATDTMLFALQAYAGVSLAIGPSSSAVAAVLLVSGFAVLWRR
jgi:hypothetical protein